MLSASEVKLLSDQSAVGAVLFSFSSTTVLSIIILTSKLWLSFPVLVSLCNSSPFLVAQEADEDQLCNLG